MPEKIYFYRPGNKAREVYETIINMDTKDPRFKEMMEFVSPIQSKITSQERSLRQQALRAEMSAVGLADQYNPVTNENSEEGTTLAWNGYLCEFVPAANNLVVPPGLDSNIRIEPFKNYQWKSFGTKQGSVKSENAIWYHKLRQARTDWGIYIMDRGDDAPKLASSSTDGPVSF